ncbi:uncharacterized protein K452DRAFT_283600 [Aplosporella prunicola CBS 121167]|uniref:Uncharacterized protein n=1 Tax=Aplosporella prunicola CBS 121167 TaxID=1176127 RepID=A0A6A6BUJ0_9PEZI|nr:uncharacterized protein K452DRAFT_283600 [Aplosporella prunicola CBS 121167]KAF2146321.1 hypothetical protein K452DRAFT_283600 [Aplosporella prunicola CBS 121167]
MSSIIGRSAFRATRALRSTGGAAAQGANGDKAASKDALKAAGKKDPELYVLWTIMAGAFGLVGWHFSRNPTSSSSENPVSKVPGTEPWQTGGSGKYLYHPGGDANASPREAPSALNTVIIPNVNLPKDLHEKYNKYGKDGY